MSDAGELVQWRPADLERAAPSAPRPDTHALVPWGVDLVDGQIVLGGVEVHPVIARDLWMRLGALLGAAERDSEQAEWERLGVELDRSFRGATPATGRVVGQRTEVTGVVQRDDESHAAYRVATFSVALLRRTKKGWEGPVYAYRPLSVGHDLRPLGMRVRLPDEAVPALRPVLQLPPPRPRLLLAGPGADQVRPAVPPAMAPSLVQRRAEVAADHALILARFTGNEPATLDHLAAGGRFPREVLLAHLETLVDLRVLARRKTPDGYVWSVQPPRTRPPPMTPERRAELAAALLGTPAPPKAPKVKAPRKGKAKPPPAPPPAPLLPFRSCAGCNTACRTTAPTCPRCKRAYRPGD